MRDLHPDKRAIPDAGKAPLDDDDVEGLIPTHLATRGELNQWEGLNIAEAHGWLIEHSRKIDALNVSFLKKLHRSMFGMTWTWAGKLRITDKSISPYHWSQVPVLLQDLVRNTATQYEKSDKTPSALDEIAMRFHHGLVFIHPWPNGNGRHARLATDILLIQWRRPPFSWGGNHVSMIKKARSAYLSALKQADGGDFRQLRLFVRS